MTRIEDPVFGKLEFDNGWIGEVFIPFLKTSFELTINNSREHPPGDDERGVWQEFMARQPQLEAAVTSALSTYYTRHLEGFRLPYSLEEEAEFAPDLQRPEDVWRLVKPLRSLWLELGHDDETTAISLEFWTKWDEEHGLSVTFYRDQIGIAEGGAHWLDQDHFDLDGQPVRSREER
jgi:hypothetical protein